MEKTQFTIIELPTHEDTRGALTVMEGALPFQIVRTYWIYGAEGQTRGGHRHKNNCQALVAICGEVSVYMNDGVKAETLRLDNPSKCLLVQPKDWHTMTFGLNAVLLVMSSHLFDQSEYIDTPYENPKK